MCCTNKRQAYRYGRTYINQSVEHRLNTTRTRTRSSLFVGHSQDIPGGERDADLLARLPLLQQHVSDALHRADERRVRAPQRSLPADRTTSTCSGVLSHFRGLGQIGALRPQMPRADAFQQLLFDVFCVVLIM